VSRTMRRECRLGIWPGEGIGPEITDQARMVVDAAAAAADLAVEWVEVVLGKAAIESDASMVPEPARAALESCDGWIMGPYDSGLYPDEWKQGRNPSATLRKSFRLFANVRPSRSPSGDEGSTMDLVIVRENTEGFYADRNMVVGSGELMPTEDLALSVGVFTRAAATEVARVACDLAARRRGKLTVAHKANVLPLGMGLFRDSCLAVAAADSRVAADEIHLDALASALVERPQDFDVLVMENLAGDVMSNLTASLTGGLGAAGSVNVGHEYAMAQASHGSAPDLADTDQANPVGIISSSAMLLDWIGRTKGVGGAQEAASAISAAAEAVVESRLTTTDMGGQLGTREVGQKIADRIKNRR
jgi:3-isopropylmalate dehydrogenase